MEEKQCPHTGEWFTPKRRNQIYASRQDQIAYNNEKARINRELVNPVNSSLLNNRNILFELLNGEAEKEVSKDLLTGKGFNFRVITGRRKIDDKMFIMFYDLCFSIQNNNLILIKQL